MLWDPGGCFQCALVNSHTTGTSSVAPTSRPGQEALLEWSVNLHCYDCQMVVASQLRIQRRIILVERYSQSLSVHHIGLGASRFLRRGECQEASVAGPYGPWAKAARWLGAGVQKAQAKSTRDIKQIIRLPFTLTSYCSSSSSLFLSIPC